MCVGQGPLERQLGMGHALDGGADAGRVHKGEHGLQALVGLADECADSTVKVQHGRGIGVDAHLVLQRAGVDTVARADRAVSRHGKLRDNKQRNATGTSRRIRQAGQHDVDDVLGQVVVA